jgi:FixJ family two-component response regulator
MHGKVFVIDDDDAARRALIRLIRAAGYEAHGLENAATYLAGVAPEPPVCLVVDIRMPGIGGLELQAQLAGTPLAVPIIFITGHGAAEIRSESPISEKLDVLEKPLDGKRLLAAVEKALAASMSAAPQDA